MENKKIKILVVDDEEDLCEILQFNLEGDGYDVDVAYSAEEALKKDLSKYKLFLLDVMMGNMSGFKLAEKIRKELKIMTPFIFITAKNTENDLLTGFNIGSDDYITKPFSIKEVLVRVKAVVRRPGRDEEDTKPRKFEFEKLFLDADKRKLFIANKEVKLTRKEFEILLLLIKSQDRYFSREEILNKVWSDDVVVSERTVDVHITRLRKKLSEYGKYLIGRSGYGYGLHFNIDE